VVYDPIRQELFTATRGAGVQLDGRRVRVSQHEGLPAALLGTGFPYRDLRYLDVYLDIFKGLLPPTAGIRRAGAAALDLAYVGAGRLDGFWEFGLKPWDMAAGALIIQEAGGLVSDLGGGNEYLASGNIVAGSPKVFKAILKAIHQHLPQDLRK
jgi:myo-inositol-1(or 4)-monophosphatase